MYNKSFQLGDSFKEKVKAIEVWIKVLQALNMASEAWETELKNDL